MIERPGEAFQRQVFGRSTSDAVRGGGCVTCGHPNLAFKSEKAEREYRISGMCQDCQESVFEEEIAWADGTGGNPEELRP